jgi:hypothetical protein
LAVLSAAGAQPAKSQANQMIPAAQMSAIQRLLNTELVFIGIMGMSVARRA